jgi:hypothetical protein
MSMLPDRTLWLFGLVALLGSSGCIIEDDDDDSAFTVGWALLYVGTEDQPTCEEAGTPTVRLTMQRRATRETFTDDFACSLGGGRSRTLPTGEYEVRIALLTREGKEASNRVGTFTIFRQGFTDLGVIGFNIQAFHISWILTRGSRSVACPDVDGRTVQLDTRLGSDPVVVYEFPCTAHAGVTTAIQLGTYAVGVRLLNSAGAVLWQNDVPMNVPVSGDRLAILPEVTFDLP